MFVVMVRVVFARPVVRVVVVLVVFGQVSELDRLADRLGHERFVEEAAAGTVERAHGPQQNQKHLRPQHCPVLFCAFANQERTDDERDEHVAATPITDHWLAGAAGRGRAQSRRWRLWWRSPHSRLEPSLRRRLAPITLAAHGLVVL